MSKRPAKIGVCALCLQTKELKNSHIVSRFLWRHCGIFDSQQSFSMTSLSHPDIKLHNQQDGFKEELLCYDCEQIFSQWEHYARPIYMNKSQPLNTLGSRKGGGNFIVGSLDYDKLKLFILSIIWRMSVAKHVYYSRVNLGDRRNEELRKHLLSAKPMPWNRYGVVFTAITEGQGMFSQPLTFRTEGGEAHVKTIIAGVHWDILISRQRSHEWEPFFLKKVGGMGEIRMDTASALDFPYLKPFIVEEIRKIEAKEKADLGE